jgi:hypothetical protein
VVKNRGRQARRGGISEINDIENWRWHLVWRRNICWGVTSWLAPYASRRKQRLIICVTYRHRGGGIMANRGVKTGVKRRKATKRWRRHQPAAAWRGWLSRRRRRWLMAVNIGGGGISQKTAATK